MRHLVALILLSVSFLAHGDTLPRQRGHADLMTVTAAGSIFDRNLASRAADTVNVKDFGAQGNLAVLNNTFSIASGSAVLTSATGTFGSVFAGRAIIVPGAGAAGAALITTILTYTNDNSVVLAAPAVTTVSSLSASIWVGTDDTAAINAAIIYARSQPGPFQVSKDLTFPIGNYLTLGGVNLTNINQVYLQIHGQGATIFSANRGAAAVDALKSRFLRWNGLGITGSAHATPTTGLQIGRTDTTANNSSDNHEFENLVIEGSFTLAGFYNLNAEQTSYKHFHVTNNYQSTNAYSAIFDGIHHWGLTSQFQTLNQPANTAQSFNSNTCIDCILYGAGQAPLWITNAANLQFINSYAVNQSSSGPYYGAVLYTYSAGTNQARQYHFDLHFEWANTSLTNLFLVSGPYATPTFTGIDVKELNADITGSVFKADTGVTAVSLLNANIDIPTFRFGNNAAVLLDTPSVYALTGYANVPNASWWNPTAFTGVWCEPTGGCRNSLPSPANLQAGSISNSGGVASISITDTEGFYNGTFPSIVIAPPASGGQQAAASISAMSIFGYGTIASGGTGYTVGDVLTFVGGTKTAAAAIQVSSVSGGVVTGYIGSGIGGVGYTALPPAGVTTVTGGTGSGLTMSGTLWRVSAGGTTVTSPGAGYLSAPAVTFLPGSGSQQAPTLGTTSLSSTLSLTASNGKVFLDSTGTTLGVTGAGGAPVITVGALIDKSGVRQSLGATYTIPANTSLVRFVQGSTVATSTVTLPTALADGQPIQIVNYAGAVTALTFSPSVNGWTNASTLAANTGLRIRWDATSAAWFREQ